MMRTAFVAGLGAALLSVAGCGLTGTTPPSNFYLLSPVAVPADAGTNARRPVSILIGPITLPKHLDRTELVTYSTPNRLQLAELDRWAEPLDENIARVLGENISRLVPTEGVFMYSGAGPFEFDYQLIIDIPRLELAADGRTHLAARWRLHRRDGDQVGLVHRFDYEEVTAPNPEMMAAAASRALASLSQDISAALMERR